MYTKNIIAIFECDDYNVRYYNWWLQMYTK